MTRFFIILMALAVLVWFGQSYFVQHPAGDRFWNSVDSPPTPGNSQPGTAATASPTPDQTINRCRTALQALAQKALMPLDQSKGFSTTDAARTLKETQGDLQEFKFEPGYKHLMQACAMMGQLLQDRQVFEQRLQRDEATPAPATTSALQPASGLQMSSGLGQPAGTGTDTTAAFFKERVLAEWNARSAQYRPSLEALMAPSN